MAEENTNNLVPQSAPGIPDSQFEFTPITELQVDPTMEVLANAVSPDYLTTLTQFAGRINTYFPAPTGNMNDPFPEPAIGSFSPAKQQSPPDLSTQSGADRFITNLANKPVQDGQTEIGPAIAPPAYFDRDRSSFDRYFLHPKFSQLGFHPYRDNETYYNANSTVYDDFARMTTQWTGLVKTGLTSVYRSLGDLFDEDASYLSDADLESAREFEKVTMIGNSSRDGKLAFTNNLILQSGYTFGIIASIAIEEAALALGTLATGGALGAPAAAKTAYNIGKGGRAVANLFNVGKAAQATRNMLRGMNNVSDARGIWNATKATGSMFTGTAARIILPETTRAVKSWATTANAAQNVNSLGRISRTFGGFYRDLRSMNYAISEGKMEAGLVYDLQLSEAYNMKKAQAEIEGREITDKELRDIQDSAYKASSRTSWLNAPFIYLTNQALLGNAIGGYMPGLNRMMQRGMNNVAKKSLARVKPRINPKTGKLNKNVFGRTDKFLGKTTAAYKRAGLKGVLGLGGRAALSFTAMNLGEGIQEVYQEAVAVGTRDYFTKLLNDPTLAGYNTMMASVDSAIDSQMNEQGFEVFMSGFLMGGVVRGPQKLLFETIPTQFQKYATPETYKKNNKLKEDYINKVMTVYNTAYNMTADDPFSVFDMTKANFQTQINASADINDSMMFNEMMRFVDERDHAKFINLYTIFDTTGGHNFRGLLEDMSKMTDQELAEAMQGQATAEELRTTKVRSRIDDLINDFNSFETEYTLEKDKNPNPFDPSLYKKGTTEYALEAIKHKTFEHARMLKMFAGDSFKRSVERSENIYRELSSDPILKKIAANDITTLLNLSTLETELITLATNIKTLEETSQGDDAASAEARKQLEFNVEKIKHLSDIRDIITEANETSKEGQVTQGDIATYKEINKQQLVDKLKKPFSDYLNLLAKSKDDYVDPKRFEDVLMKIVDHDILTERAKAYNKTISYLTNPGRLDELAESMMSGMTEVFEKSRDYYKNSVEEFVSQNEFNAFFNDLANLGVYGIPEEIEAFIQTKDVDVLKTFYSESGLVDPNFNLELADKVESLKEAYRINNEVSQEQAEEETEEETKERLRKTREAKVDEEVEDTLIAANADDVVFSYSDKTNENPFAKEMLDRLFIDYKQKMSRLNKNSKKRNEWEKTLGLKYIKAYENIKKIYISKVRENVPADELKEIIDKDIQFKDFLERSISNDDPSVNEILEIYDVKVKEILPDLEIDEIETETRVPGNTDDDEQYEGDVNIDIDPDDIDFSDFEEPSSEVTETEEENAEEVETGAPKNGVVIEKGKNFDLREIAISKSESLFRITDKNNEIPTQEVLEAAGLERADFNRKSSGLKGLEAIDAIDTTADDGLYTFGDKTVYRGADVIKTNGKDKNKEYIVGLKESDISKKQPKLYLIPRDRADELLKKSKKSLGRIKDVLKVTEKEFTDNFELDTGLTISVPANASKLSIKEGVGFFPERLTTENDTQETIASAVARTQFIFKMLTPGDVKNLRIVVKRNPKALQPRGEYYHVNKSKEAANPLLEKIYSELDIEVLLPENKVADINRALKDSSLFYLGKGLTTLERIGFLPSPNLKATDKRGNQIDLTSKITDADLFKSIFNRKTGAAEAAENFAIEEALTRQLAIELEKAGTEQIEFTFSDIESGDAVNLKDFNLQLQSQFDYLRRGKPNYQEVNLKELSEFTFDDNGTIVILTNNRIPNSTEISTTIDLATNRSLSARDRVNATRQIRQILEGAGIFKSLQGMGRYVAVIRSKSGEFTGTNLKSPIMQDASLDSIYLELFKKAAETINANTNLVNGNYIIKDMAYTRRWNREFNEKFYIATRNGFILNFNVTPSGSIELEIFAKVNQKKGRTAKVASLYISQQQVKEYTAASADRMKFMNESLSAVKQQMVDLYEAEKKIKATDPRRLAILKKASESIDLSNNSFRKTFSKSEGVNGIIENTVTSLDPRVRFDYNLYVKTGFSPLDASKDINFTLGTVSALKDSASQKNNQSEVIETEEKVNTSEIKPEKEESNLKSDVEKQIAELKQKIEEKKRGTGKKETAVERARRLKADAEFQALNKQLKKLLSSGYKIVGDRVGSMYDVMLTDSNDIIEFTDWVAENLPEFITVKDIETLEEALKKGTITLGKFNMHLQKIAGGIESLQGNIYVGARNKFKYHEAGHAVFRMLLTDQEQRRLLDAARETLMDELGEEYEKRVLAHRAYFEAIGLVAPNRITRILEDSFLEEYIMDEFDKFKTDPRSANVNSETKSFFTKLIEFIRYILGLSNNTETDRLKEFFRDIDSGKYRNYSAADNRFTRLELNEAQQVTLPNAMMLNYGVTREAFKMISIVGEDGNQRFVNQQLADETQRAIGARTIDLQEEEPGVPVEKHIEQAYEEYVALYDSEKEKYNTDDFAAQRQDLIDIENALIESTDEILQGVAEFLSLYDIKLEFEQELNEEGEEEVGIRNVGNYNKDASMLGGYESAPIEVRKLLATTALTRKDFFGNTELSPGVPIRIPIDPNQGFTAFVKSVDGEKDQLKALQKMVLWSRSNPNAEAIVNRIFQEFGLDQDSVERGFVPEDMNKPNEFNRLMKAITMMKVEYLITHRFKEAGLNQVTHYTAFKRDEASSQINVWSQNYITKRGLLSSQNARDEVIDKLDILRTYLVEPEAISNSDLNEDSLDIHETLLEYVGINLHPNFIKFSILAAGALNRIEDKDGNVKERHEGQLEFYDLYSLEKPIEKEDVEQLIILITENKPLFSDSNEGLKARMIKLALRNAPFDESVGLSVFLNEDKNLVYGNQLPTYELIATKELNDKENKGAKVDEIRQSDPFLTDNWLLNSPWFKGMSAQGMFKVSRSGGSVQGKIGVDLDDNIEVGNTREGVTYGKQDGKSFLKNLIDSYFAMYNSATGNVETVEVEVDGEPETRALAMVLTKIIETSNTGNKVPLPVIRAVESTLASKAEITPEFVAAIIGNIKAEFNNIQRESNPKTRTEVLIPNYNSDKNGLSRQEFTYERDEDGELVIDEDGKPVVNYSRGYKFYAGGAEMYLSPAKTMTEDERETINFVSSENQVKRIREGKQKYIVYRESDAKSKINFLDIDKIRKGILSHADSSESSIHNFKVIGSENMDNESVRLNYLNKFGEAIVEKDTKAKEKQYKNHTYPIKVGDKTFFTDSAVIGRFFSRTKENKNKRFVVYEVIDRLTEDQILEQSMVDNLTDLNIDADTELQTPSTDAINGNEVSTLRAQYAIDLLSRDRETGEIENYDVYTDLQYAENKAEIDKILKDNNIKFSVTKDKVQTMVDVYVNQLMEFDDYGDVLSRLLKTEGELKSQNADRFSKELAKAFANVRSRLQAEIKREGTEVSEYFKLNGYAEGLANEARKAGKAGDTITLEDALSNIGSNRKELEQYIKDRFNEIFSGWLNDINNNIDSEFSSYVTDGLVNMQGLEDASTDTANDLLNLKNNLVYNLKQIFLNNYANTKAWDQILHGNPAKLYSGPVEEVKRAKIKNLAVKSVDTINIDRSAGIYQSIDSVHAVAFEEPVADSQFSGDEIKEADAQFYQTVKGAKLSSFGIGELTKPMKEHLLKAEAGEEISGDDLYGDANNVGYAKNQAMLHSKKYAYSDGKTQLKMSKITLTFEYTSIWTGETREIKFPNGRTIVKKVGIPNPLRPRLHALREKLEREEERQEMQGKQVMAVAGPLSAFKTLKYNVNSIDNLFDTDREITDENVMALDPKYYGLQLVKPTNKEIITDPSQISILATAEQSADTVVEIQGETFRIKDVIEMYNLANSDKVIQNFTNQRNTIFTFDVDFAKDELVKSKKKGVLTDNLISLLKYSESALRASQSSGQMVSFFDVDKYMEGGYNLNSSLTQNRFESLFMSYFKESLKQKIAGDSLALLSDFGNGIYRRVYSVDENGFPERQEVIRDAVFRANNKLVVSDISILQGSFKSGDDRNITQSNLEQLIQESNGEGVIIIDRLRTNMKVYRDPKDEKSYTGERETETMLPAPNKIIFNKAKIVREMKSEQIEREFQRWTRREAWSPKAGKNIVRVEIPEFDENRSRKEFAKAFGYTYTDLGDGAIEFKTQNVNIPDVFSKMYGVRIPSQDKHSAQNIRVVDFLPASFGSTIMSARELIEISGADFDIDVMYAHMKEYFEENGEIIEYADQFDHYARYINEKVQQGSTAYGRALYRAEYEGIAVEDSEFFSEESMKALTILGLPTTIEEFNAYMEKHSYKIKDVEGEDTTVSFPPYPAAINNKILDYKRSLLGNEAMTTVNQSTGQAISRAPADTAAFEQAWDEFKEEFTELANLTNAEDLDASSDWGKFRSFVNNKSANIGAVVLPNTYLSLLREYGTKLIDIAVKVNNKKYSISTNLRFNGVKYDSFDSNQEKLSNIKKGRRVQDIKSSLITVMTDNANLQLAGKFKLNKNSAAIVSNLIQMAVPLKTSLRLINVPDITRAYNSQGTANKTAQYLANRSVQYLEFFPELIDKNVQGKSWKRQTQTIFREFGYVPSEQVEVTDDLIAQSIKGNIKWDTVEELKELVENGDINVDYARREINIINQFLKASRITQFTRKMSSLMNMRKGLPHNLEGIRKTEKDIQELGLRLTDREIERMDPKDRPLMDLRPIMKKSFMGSFLKIHNEMVNTILPSVFLSETQMFKNIVDTIKLTRPFMYDSDESALVRDVLSYITIKGYMHERSVRNPLLISRLSNDLLYAERGNIVEIVNNAKQILGDEQNTFLDIFIVPIEQMNADNKLGMNYLAANTFSRLTDDQRILVQSDFVKLMADSRTRDAAIDILHYMMLKDGLQYAYQGIVSALSPDVLNAYFSQIDLIHDAFKNNKKENIDRLLGVSYDELINDFALKYPMMTRASRYVTKLKTGPKVQVDIFNNELPIATSNRDIKEDYVIANPDTIFIVPDVESGIGVNTYSKIRKYDNVITIPIKKNVSDESSSYYKKSDIVNYTELLEEKRQEIEKALEEGKKIILPRVFISFNEKKKFKANTSKKAAAQLNGLLQETLGYNYKVGAVDSTKVAELMDVANPQSVKLLGTADSSIKSKAVYIDASAQNPTLIFQPLNKFMNYENTSDEAIEKLAMPRLTKDQSEEYSKIISFYRRLGIQPVQRKIGSRTITEFIFPSVLTYDFVGGIESEFGGTQKTRFVLKAVRSAEPGKSPFLFNEKNIQRTGLYAEYVEQEPLGGYSASPIGFIAPGEIPTLSQIRAIKDEAVRRANQDDFGMDMSVLDHTMDDFDLSNMPGGFETDGENITEIDTSADVTTEGTEGAEGALSLERLFEITNLTELNSDTEETSEKKKEDEENEFETEETDNKEIDDNNSEQGAVEGEVNYMIDPDDIDFSSFPGQTNEDLNTDKIRSWYDTLTKTQKNTLGVMQGMYTINAIMDKYNKLLESQLIKTEEEFIESLKRCFT